MGLNTSTYVTATTDPFTGRISLGIGSVSGTLPNQIGRKVGVIGHSISADAVQQTAIDNTWAQWGYLCWLRRYLGNRIDLPFTRVYAVAGKTVAQVLAEQVPTAVAATLDTCIVDVGINSVTGGVTYASMIADYTSIFKALRGANQFVIVLGIRVRNSPVALTTAQNKLVGRVNKWIAEWCRADSGMLYYDQNPLFIDASTGNAKTGWLRDGTHDNAISAREYGKDLAAKITGFMPDFDGRMIMLGDVYDATENPTGNLLTNGLFAGTSGTVTNGATGSLATSWSGYRVNASSTTSVAFSKESDSLITGLDKQVITFGGTGDSVVVQVQQTQVVPGSIAIGERVYFAVEMELSSLSVGFQNIAITASARDGAFVTYSAGKDGVLNTPNGIFAAMSDTSLFFKTEVFEVKTGTTVMDTFVTITGPASGSVSGAIKLKRAELRKAT